MSSEVQIALVGFVATVLVAAISQWMTSKREYERIRIDGEERRNDRIFEHRRDAYAYFASDFTKFWNAFNDSLSDGGPPPPENAEQELKVRLENLRIYGTKRAYELAKKALERYEFWASHTAEDRYKVDEKVDVVAIYGDNAMDQLDAFLERVRFDLGATEWGDPPV